MHRLDDIFKVAQSLLTGEPVPELRDGESPTFNTAWMIFMTRAQRNPSHYLGLWKAGVAFTMTRQAGPLTVQSIKADTQLIAISYIASALHCAQQQQVTALAHREIFSTEIEPKITLIAKLAIDIKKNAWPHTPQGTLPQEVRVALGEFYSLAMFAMRELRPNVTATHHKGIDFYIDHFKDMIAQHDLPRFLSADARAAEALTQSGVTSLPRRAGIAAGAQGNGSTVVAFNADLRRTARTRDP